MISILMATTGTSTMPMVFSEWLQLGVYTMDEIKLYSKLCSYGNLFLAWKKARKHKTRKPYVIEFEANLERNLLKLQEELKAQTYYPKPLEIFILRDPKTRKISKADFRDRIVHHAIIRIIDPIFNKIFIYDSCANRINKGNLFALNRFYKFLRKSTKNFSRIAFCLKSDIRHYFQEVNHEILINLLRRKIKDEGVILLIKKILKNGKVRENMGMPLGNLTSQFFANVYLNELDYFVKHKLKAKYYIRYVDDFVILDSNRKLLIALKEEIGKFIREKLKLGLHPDKSKILLSSKGIDFVGFRCFWHFKLIRLRNIRKIFLKVEKYKNGELSKEKMLESFNGWNAYAKWANTLKLRRKVVRKIYAPSI